MTNIYTGRREATGQQIVTVRRRGSTRRLSLAKILDPAPSQKLHNHSPDGFNWGYGGSGPAQLALAILLDVCGPEQALANYRNFTYEIVARMPGAGWQITSIEVEHWLKDHKRGREYFAAKFDGGKKLYAD